MNSFKSVEKDWVAGPRREGWGDVAGRDGMVVLYGWEGREGRGGKDGGYYYWSI
jgi:hypothetical protein